MEKAVVRITLIHHRNIKNGGWGGLTWRWALTRENTVQDGETVIVGHSVAEEASLVPMLTRAWERG